MKKTFIALFLLVPFIFPVNSTEARSGCCSHHGGVCGCGCCDGTSLSATCAPYYPSCNSHNNVESVPVVKNEVKNVEPINKVEDRNGAVAGVNTENTNASKNSDSNANVNSNNQSEVKGNAEDAANNQTSVESKNVDLAVASAISESAETNTASTDDGNPLGGIIILGAIGYLYYKSKKKKSQQVNKNEEQGEAK